VNIPIFIDMTPGEADRTLTVRSQHKSPQGVRSQMWFARCMFVRRAACVLLLVATGACASSTAGNRAETTSAPLAAAMPTPLPTIPGALTLTADQVIMPVAEFPLRGYSVTTDASQAPGPGWRRVFESTSGDYLQIKLDVYVFEARTSGASRVATKTCDLVFAPLAPVPGEVRAEVIGDAAKACNYHWEGSTPDWEEYITATRNVMVIVAGSPRRLAISNTQAMNQMISIARQQIAIIDRVAPLISRASTSAPTESPLSTPAVPPTATSSPFIVGLTFDDIRGNLEQRQIATCKEGRGTVASSLTCSGFTEDILVEVTALGDDRTKITYVQSVVTQHSTSSDEIAAQILGFLATLPYQGADPARARAWVEANIASGAKLQVGAARFILTKRNDREHELEMAGLAR
jgi:hypothetical protein